ncbi:DUF1837 domain-containing protein [Sedimentibacter sp.]|uniref:HamA C-terminal domain-containing protein n=1 Tax=Sedimentibacter sp. TaxID=1960295 RepID=UPI0028995632|nr:DUF1837 domain-containing protein [Sedimentibacter sp.]
MLKEEIVKRLANNDALFNKLHVIKQKFDIIPEHNDHIGTCIKYLDISEMRNEFINDLVDTIVDWVYSSEKYEELVKVFVAKGKSTASANSEVLRKAHQKFRKGSAEELLIQGQFGELLLFNFIQKHFGAVPLLRKMKITTSSKHERFGADAIHYKIEEGKNIVILGEAKTYTSNYKFNEAFQAALDSILDTYQKHREELNLYIHEDFLDSEMNEIAESYLEGTLENAEIHLVSIITYNETKKINTNSQDKIHEQIETIIKERFKNFDKTKIDIELNPILGRITYIIFPVWELEQLARTLQDCL